TFEVASIEFTHSGMRRDGLVHLRLRKSRFIAFVVSPAAVTYQVNQYVLVKLVAVRLGQLHCRQGGIGIIGIHMDDRDLKSLGQVTCKVGRATISRFSSKAELVVYDYMNGATHIVALEVP